MGQTVDFKSAHFHLLKRKTYLNNLFVRMSLFFKPFRDQKQPTWNVEYLVSGKPHETLYCLKNPVNIAFIQ